MSDPYPHYLPDIAREINAIRDPSCESYLSPSRLRRLFLLLSRGHWSDPENHSSEIFENLGCLKWSPEKENSTVDVELLGTERASKSSTPSIIVDVGAFQFRQISFGNRAGFSEDNATTHYITPSNCKLNITHKANYLDVAYDMAWSTSSFFLGCLDTVREILGEDSSIQPKGINPQKLEKPEPEGTYRIDSSFEISLNMSVSAVQESHKLARVFHDITVENK